jgi:hypothetical protein
MPRFTTTQNKHTLTVWTPEVELVFSLEDGGLRSLRRRDGVNVLGYGTPQPSIDVRVGRDGAWLAERAFVRYLRHTIEERDGIVDITLVIGIGPLMLYDRYRVTGTLIARNTTVQNVSEDEVRLRGVRLVVPWARIGDPEICRFEAPATTVRPRITLATAATQRRGVVPRRFFSPGPRDGRALEQAPTFAPGLMALHDPQSLETLLCWYYGSSEPADVHVEGNGQAISLIYDIGLADQLRSEIALSTGTQFLMLTREPWPAALAAFRRTQPLVGVRSAHSIAEWVYDAVIYEVHPALFGGFHGLQDALDDLCALGITTLCLLPIWQFNNTKQLWDESWNDAGDPYILTDFGVLDPSLGSGEDLRELIHAAHARGLRVIVDLPLIGCDFTSPYLDSHPEWFCRDIDGQLIEAVDDPRVCCFDWANGELQEYWRTHAVAYAREYDFDGYRAVIARHPTSNWAQPRMHHASAGNLAAVQLMERLRYELRSFKPDAAVFHLFSGPLGAASADLAVDEVVHQNFMHLALNRLSPAELSEWLDDRARTLYTNAAFATFTESYRTRLFNPLADGLRGSRLSRLLMAGLVFCGFVPLLRAGQENDDNGFLGRLLQSRARHAALRRGITAYNVVPCDDPSVFAVLRLGDAHPLVCLLKVGANKRLVTLSLPVDLLGLRDERYALYDIIRGEQFIAEGRRCWRRDELLALRLTLEPFEAYCFELQVVPQDHSDTGDAPMLLSADAEAPANLDCEVGSSVIARAPRGGIHSASNGSGEN